MATLNTSTSIVDYLKSKGNDSSFTARANLALAKGIVTSKDQYTGSAEQNTSLLKSMQNAPATAPKQTTPTTTPKEDPSSLINEGQDSDIATAGGAPGTRSSMKSLTDFYSQLATTLSGAMGSRPEATSLTERYGELRAEANVSELESRLTDLEAEQKEIDAIKRQRVAEQRDKRVAQGVIEGRVSAVERQENERIDAVNRELSYVSNQLNNKYNVINQILNLEQQDYANSVASYDAKYTQAINTLQLARGIVSDQLSIEQKAQDSARANLQIVYNAMADGAIGVEDMTDVQKTFVSKLEAESGLPVGFYELLKKQVTTTNAKMLTSTTYTDTGGKKYTDVIFQNPDGSLRTQQIYHGVVNTGDDVPRTDTQRLRAQIQDYASSFGTVRGSDGYVSPENWNYARNKWREDGFSLTDFDSNFGDLINPAHRSDYKASVATYGL